MSGAVVIAGGLGAIGARITRQLIEEGIPVVAIGRRDPDSEEVRRAWVECGMPEYLQWDMADPLTVEAIEGVGEIRAGIYCAGITHPGPIFETSAGEIGEMFAVNAIGASHFALAVGRRMAEQGHGALLYVGSWAAHVPDPDDVAYGASKAAGEAFYRGLSPILAERGVRSLTMAVGVVGEVGMAARHMADAGYAARVAGIPLSRLATADEVAAIARWLIDDAASYITGATITVDGGASVRPT